MNRLKGYGYDGLYKASKHKYKYALSTHLPCVSRHGQFLALFCIFPELISLQESCGSRFRLSSRLFGCLKCSLLLTAIFLRSEMTRVGKCSYISCSYMFLYYIRRIFVEAKMFLYFLILFSFIIILLQGCKSPLFESHL